MGADGRRARGRATQPDCGGGGDPRFHPAPRACPPADPRSHQSDGGCRALSTRRGSRCDRRAQPLHRRQHGPPARSARGPGRHARLRPGSGRHRQVHDLPSGHHLVVCRSRARTAPDLFLTRQRCARCRPIADEVERRVDCVKSPPTTSVTVRGHRGRGIGLSADEPPAGPTVLVWRADGPSVSQTAKTPASAAFGANAWLVDEMYQKYLADQSSVDEAWWDFFADYTAPAARAETESGDAEPDLPPAPLSSPSPVATPSPPTSPATGGGPAVGRLPVSTAKHSLTALVTSSAGSASAAPAVAAPMIPSPALPAPMVPTPADSPAQSSAADAALATDAPDGVGTALVKTSATETTLAQPIATAQPATAPYAQPLPGERRTRTGVVDDVQRLRGPAARVVTNMEASLSVPTATSFRSMPAKMLVDNRIVINHHLSRSRGGKVSYTHLIGFAIVEAIADLPAMNAGYTELDGKPAVAQSAHVNLGLAIDLAKPDGTRQLLVPNIKSADTMDFAHFWAAYEDVVRRARIGTLVVDDFAGTTITLTNPGTIGTVQSVPRLMVGQGAIIGVGT